MLEICSVMLEICSVMVEKFSVILEICLVMLEICSVMLEICSVMLEISSGMLEISSEMLQICVPPYRIPYVHTICVTLPEEMHRNYATYIRNTCQGYATRDCVKRTPALPGPAHPGICFALPGIA